MDCRPVFENAGKAARSLASADGSLINIILERLADYTEERIPFIIENNAKDLARMDKADPRYDRLQLTPQRIKGIASDIRNVAALPSPLGRELYRFDKPDGMIIRKVSVPFGVIGIIYEARPNVTFDVFALCIKSGNATVLKGGSDAIDSNTAITDIIREVLKEYGLDENLISLLPPGREETIQLLNARNYVDLIIPRGSQGLIDYVRKNATIPVIETGAGICHTYFDEFGNTELGQKVIHNAKTRRVSVCNALDCLVIHEKRIQDLCQLVSACAGSEVVIYADPDSYAALSGRYPAKLLMPATEESFGTEFLSYKMAIKTVRSFDEAVEHIRRYSSKHSEAIISEDPQRLELFFRMTDAAAVYTNTSTAFTDGAEFGLGAEIGISTQKLHARGPMGLKELTTYKWLIEGRGQTRS